MHSPKTLATVGGLLLKGREGRREGTEREGNGIPPKVEVS